MTIRDKKEINKLKEEELNMFKQLALILVKSKEIDKWVPVKFLVKFGIKSLKFIKKFNTA
jgi:hypothetical protein